MSAEKNVQASQRLSDRLMVYAEIYLVIQINAFLYYLNRLPILGKIVHSSWYSRYGLKKIWSLLSLAFGFEHFYESLYKIKGFACTRFYIDFYFFKINVLDKSLDALCRWL